MPLKAAALEEPQMNLTPMLDVVFNLIIFFMVGTHFADLERQFDVNLPKVSDAQPLVALPDEIVINVYGDGRFKVGQEWKTLEELLSDLSAARSRYADQAVLIRGEGAGPYQYVMDVLSACQQAGITNTALATELEAEARR